MKAKMEYCLRLLRKLRHSLFLLFPFLSHSPATSLFLSPYYYFFYSFIIFFSCLLWLFHVPCLPSSIFSFLACILPPPYFWNYEAKMHLSEEMPRLLVKFGAGWLTEYSIRCPNNTIVFEIPTTMSCLANQRTANFPRKKHFWASAFSVR